MANETGTNEAKANPPVQVNGSNNERGKNDAHQEAAQSVEQPLAQSAAHQILDLGALQKQRLESLNALMATPETHGKRGNGGSPTDLLLPGSDQHRTLTKLMKSLNDLRKSFWKRLNINPNVVNAALFVTITVQTIASALPNEETSEEYKRRMNLIIPLTALPLIIAGGLLPEKIKIFGKEVSLESLQEISCSVAHFPALEGGIANSIIGYFWPNARPSNWYFLLGLAGAGIGGLSWHAKENMSKSLLNRIAAAASRGIAVWGVVDMARQLQKQIIDLHGGFPGNSDDAVEAAEDKFELNSLLIGAGIGLGVAAVDLAIVGYILAKRAVNSHLVHKLIKTLAFIESIFFETPLSMLFSLSKMVEILAVNENWSFVFEDDSDPLNIIWPMLYNSVFLALSLYAVTKGFYKHFIGDEHADTHILCHNEHPHKKKERVSINHSPPPLLVRREYGAVQSEDPSLHALHASMGAGRTVIAAGSSGRQSPRTVDEKAQYQYQGSASQKPSAPGGP